MHSFAQFCTVCTIVIFSLFIIASVECVTSEPVRGYVPRGLILKNEAMENFINQARQSFREATTKFQTLKMWALRFGVSIHQLNQNIEAFLINEGVLEVESPESSTRRMNNEF
jgi:uncharacterized MAPEG superfamily protein